MVKYRALLFLLILAVIAPQPLVARSSRAPSFPPLSRTVPFTQVTQTAPLSFSVTNAASVHTVHSRTRFEPALFKQLLAAPEDELIRGIVWMHDQADLSQVSAPATDRLAHQRAVVEHLQRIADRAQAGTLALLQEAARQGQVTDYRPLWIVNAIAVRGTPQVFWALADQQNVRIILHDRVRHLPEQTPVSIQTPQRDEEPWNLKRIEADRVWEALGVTGEGVVVANLDSGVDWQHPDLMTAYRGYTGKPFPTHVGNWFCATDERYVYPGDGLGHGTHTMGTIVGQNGIGVAPGARWIAAKVFDNQGVGLDSWIHAGYQWVLAPGGDPAMAPDVVNSSWGNSAGTRETFLPDLLALRAAGILPIFAAGNSGPDPETIWAPASLGPALAVGATDEDDRIAHFSSRGPSPWGEIKPEISAPGVHIVSAIPGGGRAEREGTSMAAPHVAGIVALMRQANPALGSEEAEAILIETARPLGDDRPNNQYGWGLVNAYAAVSRAGSFGRLEGRVSDLTSGAAIPQATVHAISHGGQYRATATTDASGAYSLNLQAGRYDVTVHAFGYHAQTTYGSDISAGGVAQQDVALALLPTGTLEGSVTQADTGGPLVARVYIPGSPPSTTSTPDGSYRLVLPQGTHTVRAEAAGHRYVTATVAISPSETTSQRYVLEPAPSILLVDSGAWYNDSRRAYYQDALEVERYLYDLRVIANVYISPTDVPELDDLRPYDLVLWSAPQDAPGYVGASDAVAGYLEGGGRLFLSGQDVAFWDGGGSHSSFASYFQDHLKAKYVADDAPSRTLTGQGTLYAGLTITISGGDGADNQAYPDVIAVDDTAIDGDLVQSTWSYHMGGSGGQAVGLCLPYRATYLAFGLEGVNAGPDRQEIVRRSIAWLTAPPEPTGIALKGDDTTKVGPAGTEITHSIRLRNLSELYADAVALDAQGHNWPTSFQNPQSVVLSACQTMTVSVSVDVPPDVGWHVSDTTTIEASSTLSPGIQATTVLTSKTPAPLLLVDGARFYRLNEPYQRALDEAGVAYDSYAIHQDRSRVLPISDRLAMYPMVMWYTGYDWFDPLGKEGERALTTYLQQGGRVGLSSQDYLYYGHQSPLAQDYLGVLGYREGLSTTVALGETFHRIGWGIGPLALEFPYPNWSDALIPAQDAQVAFRGQHAYPIGLTHRPERSTGERWRTTFLAFPFETLPEDAATEVMQRTIGWLSWLGASTWGTHGVHTVSSGSTVSLTGVVRNDGPAAMSSAQFSATLPGELSLVPGTLSPWATYAPGARQVTWKGALDRDQQIQIDLSVQVDDPLPDGTAISLPAVFGYDEHALSFEWPLILRVNAPDLSASTLNVEPALAPPSSTLTYTLNVRNTGVRGATAIVTASAPYHSYFTGTLDSQGVGIGEILSQSLAWQGTVPAGDQVRLRYHMTSGDADGDWLVHQAHVQDQFDEQWPVEALAYVWLRKAYLPIVYRPSIK